MIESEERMHPMQITAASQQQRADDLAFCDLGYAEIGFVIRTSFELNVWVEYRTQRKLIYSMH